MLKCLFFSSYNGRKAQPKFPDNGTTKISGKTSALEILQLDGIEPTVKEQICGKEHLSDYRVAATETCRDHTAQLKFFNLLNIFSYGRSNSSPNMIPKDKVQVNY